MGPEITANPYHQHTVRSALTRNIGRCLPQMHDEFVRAFEDEFALEGAEWKEITVMPHALQVVARTTARVFAGLPLCEDRHSSRLCGSHIHWFQAGTRSTWTSASHTPSPSLAAPRSSPCSPASSSRAWSLFSSNIHMYYYCAHNRIFGRLLSSRRSSVRQAMKTLGPVIEERLTKDAELGPGWVDRPVCCRS